MSKFPSKVEKYCAQNGIRLTSRRRQVLNELLASKKALSAYELVETCNNQNEKNISAMSIYRILQFLEEQHLAHKLNLANKYVACSHIMCDHEHDNSQFLICESTSLDANLNRKFLNFLYVCKVEFNRCFATEEGNKHTNLCPVGINRVD